jgi:RimJ/RimL family protein N-acetyltransferase
MEDAPDLAAVLNNRSVQDNLRDGLPYPYTPGDAEEFISGVLSDGKDKNYIYAILFDGKIAGNIGIIRKENVHRLTGELGYYVAEASWGRGIATEAVKQICSMVFGGTDIIRIFAEPFASNAASCRVLEKAGFQFEGIMRQNAIKNGQILDSRLYSKIK